MRRTPSQARTSGMGQSPACPCRGAAQAHGVASEHFPHSVLKMLSRVRLPHRRAARFGTTQEMARSFETGRIADVAHAGLPPGSERAQDRAEA